MSNPQVSYDAIIDACAMCSVSFTIAEIDKMLIGEKPIVKEVANVIERLANNEPIELHRDTPLRDKNEPRDIYKDVTAMLYYLVSNGDYTRVQLAELVGVDNERVSDLMGRLRRKGLVKCSSGLPESRTWSVIRTEDGGVWISPRQKAIADGVTHYEGSIHKACGTHLRVTSNGECVQCRRQRNSIKSYSKH